MKVESQMMFEKYGKDAFQKNYNQNYSASQLAKFMFRKGNHWRERVEISFDLVSKLELIGKDVLDLGTSIGTYAIEFALRGFNVQAIDLDDKAIKIAGVMAKKYELDIDFKTGDISDRSNFKAESFDIISAMDIIEHLPRPVLEKTIANCYHWLRPGGYLIYHTVPLKYDVIFHKSRMWYLLVPFCLLPERVFNRLTEIDYKLYNVIQKLTKGKSYQQQINETVHCNLQTRDQFIKTLKGSGFHNAYNKVCTTEERFRKGVREIIFKNKEYYKKDLFGVAWKPFDDIFS